MSTVLERIALIAENENITIGKLEKIIGASKGVLSRALANNTDIQAKWITNIVENYPQYSCEWLITGNGGMINSPDKKVDVKETFTLRTDHKVASQSVPLYRITAQAGIIALFDDSSSDIPIGQIQIPNLPRCDGALYVFGESMQPILQSGDIILYKKVSVDNILWGEMYLVAFSLDGDDYVAIKYIQKANDPQKVTLVSRNSSYAPQDIPWNSIRALALIKASIRFNTMG